MTTSATLAELLERNRRWAAETESRRPGFFTQLIEQQAPQYLWIGCADSRVPANELVGLLPGELFVHRNVANVVVHSDLNCLSVIQFAVEMLKVRHIIVVGHSNCGGVRAALTDQRAGLVDNWLRHVQDVRDMHRDWLHSLPADRRADALCELNVVEQARNVCRTTVVTDAWQRGQAVEVNGWIYGLHNGMLRVVTMAMDSPQAVERAYVAAVASIKARHEAVPVSRDDIYTPI